MGITPTYPGVYIEEVSSGVRTITGVATSIAAFIGRAERGPVNEPITINNFGDYERRFGGLWLKSTMSFAVRDFFLNGGGQAIIVRLENGASAAEIRLPTGAPDPDDELNLIAANVGSWGNNLSASVDYDTKDPSDINLFNLTISEQNGVTEKFPNVSIDVNSARYLPGVLEERSTLARVIKNGSGSYLMPDTRPVESTSTPLSPPTSPPMSPPASPPGSSDLDGNDLTQAQFIGSGLDGAKQGLYALEKADLFTLLCIPPYTFANDIGSDLIAAAVTYCEKRRAMFIVDPPGSWTSKDTAKTVFSAGTHPGTTSNYAALFFPRLKQPNPLRDNQVEEFVPCGAVAGVFARTDAQRGVWKAPAGQEAQLKGVPQLSVPLTDAENGELNQLGINCLRTFPVYGRLVWGSRTLEGANRLTSEWKYIPVRRTALFIEESLFRGTKWVVFEPNDEPLWAQIRLNVGAFMHNLFRQGAFQGATTKEAYLVKCDKETTTQTDINNGIVNIIVGFAPLKPAEFVFIKIQQLAGQIET
ncbi:MAG: phage tail sheath subtilisin-like domain-containing protein [Candidatus Aminicenantes bacterium]|jgi:phage tail sheath protein FI